MKHSLHISYSDKTKKYGIFSCKKVSVRERLLRLLLGGKERLTVIVPSDSVDEVTVKEIKK